MTSRSIVLVLRTTTASVVLLALLAVTASPAFAAGSIALSTHSGPAGTTVTVTGHGFHHGQEILCSIGGNTARSWLFMTPDNSGNFSGEITIPSTMVESPGTTPYPTIPGKYVITC